MMYAGAHVNVNWKANAVGCAHVRNANYDVKKKHILVVVELTQASPFQKTKAICVVESFLSTAAVQQCPKYLETDAIGKSEKSSVGDKHNNTATSMQGLCCEVRVAVGPKARGRRKVPKDTIHKLDLVYTKSIHNAHTASKILDGTRSLSKQTKKRVRSEVLTRKWEAEKVRATG